MKKPINTKSMTSQKAIRAATDRTAGGRAGLRESEGLGRPRVEAGAAQGAAHEPGGDLGDHVPDNEDAESEQERGKGRRDSLYGWPDDLHARHVEPPMVWRWSTLTVRRNRILFSPSPEATGSTGLEAVR